MAKLTDKQKADAILGDVEPEKAAETTNQEDTDLEPEEQENLNEPEQAKETATETPEEEKPTEGAEEPATEAPTFTKQFPNLKGETLAEYTPELEKAYDNSFKEALRLNNLVKEKDATIAQFQAQLQGQPIQPLPTTQPPAEGTQPVATLPTQPQLPPLQTAINQIPEIQRIKAVDTQAMFSAFDDFKKEYPIVTEPGEFDRFTKVSNGVQQALTDELGRIPTWKELYAGIAGTLHWAPINPAKDAAVKNAGVSTHTNSATLPPAKQPKVSDAQVDAYQKMFTSKTREEAIKELSEVV
jgi:hypothetical protein